MSKGGAVKPVFVVRDEDLEANGGKYVLRGRIALPVEGLHSGALNTNQPIGGGTPDPVYIVREADLQKGGGRYIRGGGKPVRVVDLTQSGRNEPHKVAQPVYLRSGWPYYNKALQDIWPGNLKFYWPLWEESGAVANNIAPVSGAAFNGIHINTTRLFGIGDGRRSAFFNGTTSAVDVFDANFHNHFNGHEGTLVIWGKVLNAGVWTDSTARRLLRFRDNANNEIFFRRLSTDNRLNVSMDAGGVNVASDIITSTLDWFMMSATWSEAADEFKVYFNDAQNSVTVNGLGVWAGGGMTADQTQLGANSINPVTSGWSGFLAHCMDWDYPLELDKIQALYNLGPV